MAGFPRWLAVVLVAVLTGAPIVRTVCAFNCGPDRPVDVASSRQDGHCAQPKPPVTSKAAVAAIGDCLGCDLFKESPRAAVRSVPTTAAELPSMSSAWIDFPLPAERMTSPFERAGSPPSPTRFPLRI